LYAKEGFVFGWRMNSLNSAWCPSNSTLLTGIAFPGLQPEANRRSTTATKASETINRAR